jgi:hypothetical protein
MMTNRVSRHEESWLLLPWVANGRLCGAERAAVEEHLAACPECTEELARQRLMCEALTEPERVTYAPGPSFRKLMERIDGQPSAPWRRQKPPARPSTPLRGGSAVWGSVWRPPGLAWAASFLMAMGLAVFWSQPRYVVHTVVRPATPNVLHVAFDRSLPIGELDQMLHTLGAHVVEGPGTTGIFGVAPVGAALAPPAGVSPEMHALAARLRADARVRWVEPLYEADEPGVAQGPRDGGS